MFEVATAITGGDVQTVQSLGTTLLHYGKTGIAMAVLLGVLIAVHEWGHFLVARRNGIGVEVFALGFGKPLFVKQFGETEFRLCVFPLGGYVKLVGEDPDEELSEEQKKASFSLASPFVRLKVAFAGPLFNFLLAIGVFFVVYMVGVPVLSTTVGKVMENSAAMDAGLLAGDKIIAINGKEMKEWADLTQLVHKSAGVPLSFSVERVRSADVSEIKTDVLELTITPRSTGVKNIFGETEIVGLIGIQPDPKAAFSKRYNPVTALWLGVKKTAYITWMTLVGIVKLVEGVVPKESVGGPILIMQMAGQQAEAGLMPYALFVAFISLNLGIINLLPVPVLDGGHIMFSLLEMLMGRPLSEKVQENANRVGLSLLLLLMVFAFYNDIMRLVTH